MIFPVIKLKLPETFITRLPVITQAVHIYLPCHPGKNIHEGIATVPVIRAVIAFLLHVVEVNRRSEFAGKLVAAVEAYLVTVEIVIGYYTLIGERGKRKSVSAFIVTTRQRQVVIEFIACIKEVFDIIGI